MSIFNKVWQFCSFLFVPQMGRQRRRREEMKRQITYLIGQERADGNLQELSAEYIGKVLHVDEKEVRELMREIVG